MVSSTDQLTVIDTSNKEGKVKFADVQKKYELANSAIDKLTNHVATALMKKQ